METYVIHVTKKCNCACTYCYEDDKSSTYTWEELKALLDNIVKHSTGAFSIEFLGGEPLLAFDHVKKSVEYLADKATHYTITTNGTVLTDEIVQFLKEHPNVNFAVSLDGHKYANFMRVFKENLVNTYDVAVRNMQRLMKEGISPSVHFVTHPYNVAYLADSIDHLYKLGIRGFGIGTVEKTIIIDDRYCDRFIAELDLVSQRYVEGRYPGLSIDLFNWVKPYTDVRTYLKDTSGKVIGESYGRAGNDVTSTSEYNVTKCVEKTPVSEMIYRIRRTVYNNHQRRVAGG